MRVTSKRALWLNSAVFFAAAGLATTAWAEEPMSTGMSSVQVTQALMLAQPADEAEDDDDEDAVEAVVVTGSRLRRNEFTSSAPIQVITTEETTLEGLNDTADIVQSSSLAAGSQQINNTFGGFVTQGGPGANTVSLRGLGSQRTLVLVNGRRISPAGTRGQLGAPDLNTIPESMVERIEILKDGGSSVYGSDAVAGVVNFILRRNFDGLTLSASTNQTMDGGGETYQVNGSWGKSFDNGYFSVAAEWYRRDTLTRGDRDFLACNQDQVIETGTGIATSGVGVGNYLDLIDPSTGQSKCFNLLANVVDTLAGPGTVGRFIYDPTAVLGGGLLATDLAGWKRVGPSYAQTGNNEVIWRALNSIVPNNEPGFTSADFLSPVERYSVMLTGAYDLWDNVEAYGELSFARRDSSQHRYRQIFPNVSGTNPNNPFGRTSRSIIMIPTDGEQQVDYYRGVIGIRGDLGWDASPFAGWGYDVYFQHIRSEADYTNDIIYNDRVSATVAAATVCNQALITISGGNCADVPGGIRWFNPGVVAGNWSQAESDFLFTKETGHTTYAQTLFNASITGDLFELPAGPVGMALGVEWRKDELDDTPGFNARNNNLWGQTSAGRTAGSDTVKEFFTEVSVPVFAGMFMVEDLTIDGSWRWTDYDSYGEDTTYKVGLNWRVTPEFRIRATKGTSFRAPALFEMFLANQTGFLSQLSVDPCINWGSSANPLIVANCGTIGLAPAYNGPYSSALILTGGGGPGVLKAEQSEASTIGVIFTPDWIDLSVAVDYWTFQVDDQVATYGAFNVVNSCYTAPDFPANPFCSLFVRDTNPLSVEFGKIISVNNSYVNISNQHTEGMDLTVRYRHEFPWFDFTGTTQATWTFTDQFKTFPISPTEDFNGELYDPDFVANVDLRFDRDNWTFFWNVDVASRASNNEQFGGQVFSWRGTQFRGLYKQHSEFSAVHDMSLRYRGDNWSIIGGMQNVFDDPPPSISTGGGFGRAGVALATGGPYDLLGRRVFFEVVKSF